MRAIDRIRRSGVGIGPDRTIRQAAQVVLPEDPRRTCSTHG